MSVQLQIDKLLTEANHTLQEFETIDGRRFCFSHKNVLTQDSQFQIESLLDALQWYANLANEAGDELAEESADTLIKKAYFLLDQI